jgi:hypothetical protein
MSGKRLAELKAAKAEHITEPTNDVHTSPSEGDQAFYTQSPFNSDYSLSSNGDSLNELLGYNSNNHNNDAQPKPQSLYSALFETGKLLNIACGTNFPSKSKPAPPGTPASLQPTLLQLSTVHWQWIDRFPFPDFRDEMIIHSGDIDEEEFLGDLFSMEPFTLAVGASPADPYAYTMNPEFRAKWGYLFPSFALT